MTVGFSITKRASLVSIVAAPDATTRPMLSHCMVSIGLRRAIIQPICTTPSPTPSATASMRFLVTSRTARKSSVDARSVTSSRADCRRLFMRAPTLA